MRKILVCVLILVITACSPLPRKGENPLSTQGQDPNSNTSTAGNGQTMDTIVNPYSPQASDSTLERQQAFVVGVTIKSLATTPVQFEIKFEGNLPTPCNQLRIQVYRPDVNGMIAIEVFSVVDPGQICAQVLQPFSVIINVGSFLSGVYPVQVNGTSQGDITAP